MSKNNSSYLNHLDFLFLDIVSLCVSFVLAYWIKFKSVSFWKNQNWAILLFVMVLLDVILTFYLRPYKGIFRRSYYHEIGNAFLLMLYNLVITFVVFYVLRIGTVFSRMVLVLTYAIYFVLSVIVKYAWKKHLSRQRHHDQIPLFIVGSSDNIDAVIRNIYADDFLRYAIEGVYLTDSDLAAEKPELSLAGDSPEKSIPIISGSITDFVTANKINEVMITIPSTEMPAGEYKKLAASGVTLDLTVDQIIGVNPENMFLKHVGLYHTFSIGRFQFSPMQSFYLIVKRILDILIGLVGSLFLLPLWGIVKCAYLISGDKANVIYRQTRVGKDGKLIRIFKFRSMVPNAEEMLEKLLKKEKYRRQWEDNQKLDDDPRITKVGNFLRKTSLDELPQLLNVLVGDMSFVGPRPLVEGELEHHNGLKLYQRVRPGITGWWGCNGRSDIDYKERLELEYYYVRNVSLYLDFLTIIRTIFALVKRKGAK